jgi:hypothetical protein
LYATFYYPHGITVDVNNDLYVSDNSNSLIRKITSAGLVTTYVGTDTAYTNAIGTFNRLNNPTGLAFDSSGYLFVGDMYNIRKIVR